MFFAAPLGLGRVPKRDKRACRFVAQLLHNNGNPTGRLSDHYSHIFLWRKTEIKVFAKGSLVLIPNVSSHFVIYVTWNGLYYEILCQVSSSKWQEVMSLANAFFIFYFFI